MEILCLDIGSYSVKAALYTQYGKSFTLEKTEEIVLDDLSFEHYPQETIEEKQVAVAKELIPANFPGKVYCQLPPQFITSRYLNLPVTQKKKVEMMIPFQLDENLPFPSNHAHFTSELIKEDNQTHALLNITKKQDFDPFYNFLEAYNVELTALTSELSIFNTLAQHKKIEGPVAIVDIGHTMASCYIIYHNRVVLNHIAHSAGASIDEAIASSYNIPLDEAIIYKQQNCFLLTDEQIETVNDKQKEFALLMKQTVYPLVHDIKRWLIGFRVKYGMNIEKIYLTGGSSHINNIHYYLSDTLKVHVEPLSTVENIKDPDGQLRNKEDSFFLTNLMAQSLTAKQRPANFLIKEYSNGASTDLPLHSMTFMGMRSLIVFIVLSLFTVADNYFLTQDLKKMDQNISKMLRKPDLALKKTEYKRWKRKLPQITKKLKKSSRTISQEIRSMMSSTKVNGLGPLFTVNQILANTKDLELIKFKSDGRHISGTIRTKDKGQFSLIKSKLKHPSIKNITFKKEGQLLSFRYKGQK